MDMGAHARAAQAAELALALAPQVGDPALVARMHRSVARTFLAEGRIAEADASLAKAQAMYRQLQLRTELAHCHWMRGYVHAQNGELDAAEEELRTARDMLSAKRAALYTARSRSSWPTCCGSSAGPRRPPNCCSRCWQLGDRPRRRARGRRAPAPRPDRRGARDTEAAEEHYVRALACWSAAGRRGDLADLCRLLGDLLRRTGRVEAALDAYRTGLGHRTAPGTTTLGPAPVVPAQRPARISGSRWAAGPAE